LQLLSSVSFGLAVGFIAVLATVLFFFAVPVWDDLIRATRPAEVGWWGYVYGFVYKHWQGRWASCGLESFILPRVDITRYYWVLLCSVALVDTIAAFAVCRWFSVRKSLHHVAGIALGFLALLWTAMPSVKERPAVSETVYWFTGAVENAMVYALAGLLLMAIINLSPSASAAKKTLTAAGFCLAAICICGFHELYGLMFCIALAIGAAAAWVDRDPKAGVWSVVTVAAGLGLLVVILAPGNTARFASDGGPHARQFGYDLRVAMSQVRHYLPRWLVDPKFIGASLWVIGASSLKRPHFSGRFSWRWIIPLAWLTMLAAGFFAPSWAFGNAMPPRTLAGVYIIFTMGWLLILWLWSPLLRSIFGKWSRTLGAVGLTLFSISMLFTGTAFSVMHDYRSRVFPWHRAMEHRYALLRNAAGTDALIPPLPKPPWNLLDGEIVDDPADYRNWSTVSFFHLRSVRLQPNHGSPPPAPDKPTRPPAKGMGT
jgi:hypothetical protein